MDSAFCLWLAEVEESLWRMIRGAFRFTFHCLPAWFIRSLFYSVGPAVVRLFRVLAVFALWLAVVFTPPVAAGALGVPFWVGVAAWVWLVLSLSGSAWGLSRLARKRRLAAGI